jgi:TatD DNase family protein
MKIDVHRHAADAGHADRVVRNLFHDQADQLKQGNYYSAGLHPWHVQAETLQKDLASVRSIADLDEVIAIGEAGLDKSIRTSLELQNEAFIAQIEMAVEFGKPLIIHCVKAYNEVFDLHRRYKPREPWIIHWFNASAEMGKQLTSNNFYLSFGHMLFRENSKAYNAFPAITGERIFLETDDAGYTITEIYEQATRLRGIGIRELEKQVERNFQTCFGKKA